MRVQTNVFPPNPAGLDYSGVQAAYVRKHDATADYLGYVLEVKVPLAILGITPQPGWKLGIDFQINDNDAPGARDRYVTWFGSSLNNNPAAYGTVVLGQMDTVPPRAVTGVSVTPAELTLEVGETTSLVATVTPADASNQAVTWSTSDAAVATVDDEGQVTAVGPGGVTVTVTTDDGAFTANAVVTVVRSPGSVPEITTLNVPSGEVGAPYAHQLEATGGDGELIWSVAAGSLPNGLVLSTAGSISGTPLEAGANSFTVRVADSDGDEGSEDEDTQLLTLTIAPPPPVAATVTLGQLAQRYDGLPKAVDVATDPAGLAVLVTYDGRTEPPVYPGVYDVTATVVEAGYTGEATAELRIGITALVARGLALAGEIDGSLQVLRPESTTLNSGAMISGDLLVSGQPNVTVNGDASYVAVIEADGAATPTEHTVTLNRNTVVRYVVRRVDPVALPTVAAPPGPAGTRDVAINQAGQGVGDPATLRNLTINANGAEVAVPPGTYGQVTVNGKSTLILGTPGASEPAVYNLQKLTFNSRSRLRVVGPVCLTVADQVTLNDTSAAEHDASHLTLQVYAGGLTLNGRSALHAHVVAPADSVVLDGASLLRGSVTADRLTLNKQAALHEPDL